MVLPMPPTAAVGSLASSTVRPIRWKSAVAPAPVTSNLTEPLPSDAGASTVTLSVPLVVAPSSGWLCGTVAVLGPVVQLNVAEYAPATPSGTVTRRKICACLSTRPGGTLRLKPRPGTALTPPASMPSPLPEQAGGCGSATGNGVAPSNGAPKAVPFGRWHVQGAGSWAEADHAAARPTAQVKAKTESRSPPR